VAVLETTDLVDDLSLDELLMNVLVLNAGSSSLKFQLIATDRDAIAANKDVRLCRGQIDRFGG